MGNFLSSLPKTIHASLGLAVLLFLGFFLEMMVLNLIDIFGVGSLDLSM